jgi:phage baseplate assembly protein W
MIDPTSQSLLRVERFLDFPISVGDTGGLQRTDADDHLRDLILQVLFTEPGERVNLPNFGCGVKRLAFAPNNEVLRASAQFLIAQNLNHWLEDRIVVEAVRLSSDLDEEYLLQIDIIYLVKATRLSQQLTVKTGRP